MFLSDVDTTKRLFGATTQKTIFAMSVCPSVCPHEGPSYYLVELISMYFDTGVFH
jgi:hypothetical protein